MPREYNLLGWPGEGKPGRTARVLQDGQRASCGGSLHARPGGAVGAGEHGSPAPHGSGSGWLLCERALPAPRRAPAFSQQVEQHREDEHRALDHLLGVGRDAEQVQAVREDADDERARQRTTDAADATRQRRAAEHRRGDGVKLPADGGPVSSTPPMAAVSPLIT